MPVSKSLEFEFKAGDVEALVHIIKHICYSPLDGIKVLLIGYRGFFVIGLDFCERIFESACWQILP